MVEVPAGKLLLEVAREHGLPLARGCSGAALCGRCGVRVLGGAEALSPEDPEETKTKRRNRVPATLRLACRARVEGDVEVTASYW